MTDPAVTKTLRGPLIAGAVVMVGMIVILAVFGRQLWCNCGQLWLSSWDIHSQHNSQHILDPYTFTHIMHGVLFFGFLYPLKTKLSLAYRAVAAIGLEALWEVVENSSFIIDRYRETAAAANYFGDSIANSIADVGWCALGFFIAARLPWWASLGLFVLTEVVLAWWIRDNLMLNVLNLTFPIEAVSQWQAGAI